MPNSNIPENSSDEYRRILQGGAQPFAPSSLRRPLRFRAFNGDSLTPSTPLGAAQRAPRLATAPAEPIMVDGAVLHPINAERDPEPLPKPKSPAVFAPAAPEEIAANVVIFKTDAGDFEFHYSHSICAGPWLSLIGPKFPKLRQESVVQIELEGRTLTVCAMGLDIELPAGGRLLALLLADD